MDLFHTLNMMSSVDVESVVVFSLNSKERNFYFRVTIFLFLYAKYQEPNKMEKLCITYVLEKVSLIMFFSISLYRVNIS